MLCGGILVTKRIIRHLPSTAEHFFLSLFLRLWRGHPPHRGPGLPIMGAAKAECRPSRFRGRRDRAIIQLSCPSMIYLTLGLTTHRTAGHEKSIILQKFSLLMPRLRPPLWSGLLSPRADAIRENRGLYFNCHEDNLSFKHCTHPFITASGCLNPELGQLGDDDVHRR